MSTLVLIMTFTNEPSWLDEALHSIPELPSKAVLLQERSNFGVNLPWSFFLEHKLEEVGQSGNVLLDFLTGRFPSLLPVSLESADQPKFGERFPKEFVKEYFLAPFNSSPPFLSVAIIEPDLLQAFHVAYVPWGKANTFCLLQYFLVLPSSFKNYLSKR